MSSIRWNIKDISMNSDDHTRRIPPKNLFHRDQGVFQTETRVFCQAQSKTFGNVVRFHFSSAFLQARTGQL